MESMGVVVRVIWQGNAPGNEATESRALVAFLQTQEHVGLSSYLLVTSPMF